VRIGKGSEHRGRGTEEGFPCAERERGHAYRRSRSEAREGWERPATEMERKGKRGGDFAVARENQKGENRWREIESERSEGIRGLSPEEETEKRSHGRERKKSGEGIKCPGERERDFESWVKYGFSVIETIWSLVQCFICLIS
jgi:hypothetical protein